MICKMCGEEKELIQAHIIPKSLYGISVGKGNSTVLLDLNRPFFKPVQSSDWDDGILCHDCDNKFSPNEDYVAEFIKSYFLSGKRNNASVFESEIDSEKFKLFITSVLYKASITKRDYFKSVNLGEYEGIFREWLIDDKIKKPELLEIVVEGALKHPQGLDLALSAGIEKGSIDGIPFYSLYIPGMMLWVKVGNLKLPERLKPSLSNSKISFSLRPFEELSEGKKILRQHISTAETGRLPDYLQKINNCLVHNKMN